MAFLLKREPKEIVQAIIYLIVTCSKSRGICALTFWVCKYLSWIILLTNIECFTNTKLVQGSGQIEVEFGLDLSLSFKTNVCFLLHDSSLEVLPFG